MPTQFSITIHGDRCGQVDDIDRMRAEIAALEIFKESGWEPADAWEAFKDEWEWLGRWHGTPASLEEGIEVEELTQDYAHMRTPGALVWLKAQEAASLALTWGWAKPGTVTCTLER
jgi:hypothetical protein